MHAWGAGGQQKCSAIEVQVSQRMQIMPLKLQTLTIGLVVISVDPVTHCRK